MAEGINVRLTGKLHDYVKMKSDPEQGFFSSASEYIRDLVRHDFDSDEAQKWQAIGQRLTVGMNAEPSEFIETDAQQIIAQAKKRKASCSDGA
ncbi:MAG: hypothetical protein L3J39_11980 [Verrucomicrobiales bacterium]|nr:hypothetical protein [Verrucomicrobiales bacterium]